MGEQRESKGASVVKTTDIFERKCSETHYSAQLIYANLSIRRLVCKLGWSGRALDISTVLQYRHNIMVFIHSY